jgi:hypothetical protein
MFAVDAQKLDWEPITFDTFHSAVRADKVKEKGPSHADTAIVRAKEHLLA